MFYVLFYFGFGCLDQEFITAKLSGFISIYWVELLN